MDIKEIKIRKSMSLTGLVIILLMVMAIFTSGYYFIMENAQDNDVNVTINDKYVHSFGNLTEAQNDLEGNVNEIRNSVESIKEADNTFEVAWNGLKGLGATLKLPISFVSTSIATWESLLFPIDFLPGWLITLITIGIIATIIFLVLSILKGEAKT